MTVRQEPISKTSKITNQADDLYRRGRLSKKAQVTKVEVGRVKKDFLAKRFYIDKISSLLLCNNPTLVEFSYATGNKPREYSSFRDYL